jgi:FixJ family two-component response regulator
MWGWRAPVRVGAMPLMLFTAHDDGPTRTQASQAWAVDDRRKPCAEQTLIKAMASALDRNAAGPQDT